MDPSWEIRESRPSDSAEIGAMLVDGFLPELRPYLTYAQPGVAHYLDVLLARPDLYPNHELSSAVDHNGRIRGFAEFRHLDGERTLTTWIVVDESARGAGLGTRMLRHASNKFAGRRMQVDVFDTNLRARRLYDQLGFQPVSAFRWYTRALPEANGRSHGLDVRSWHEAQAAFNAYGFCQIRAEWHGRPVTFGLLGASIVRVDAPELFGDETFLRAVKYTFPQRQGALHMAPGAAGQRPDAQLLLEATRLEARSLVLP